jgi:hypothetical protein
MNLLNIMTRMRLTTPQLRAAGVTERGSESDLNLKLDIMMALALALA